jgi:hypothetical protein
MFTNNDKEMGEKREKKRKKNSVVSLSTGHDCGTFCITTDEL